jgi:hypothetical protein
LQDVSHRAVNVKREEGGKETRWTYIYCILIQPSLDFQRYVELKFS